MQNVECRGLTGKENPGEARVCFLIDPQINLGAKYNGKSSRVCKNEFCTPYPATYTGFVLTERGPRIQYGLLEVGTVSVYVGYSYGSEYGLK
jgi:hypothetical protein